MRHRDERFLPPSRRTYVPAPWTPGPARPEPAPSRWWYGRRRLPFLRWSSALLFAVAFAIAMPVSVRHQFAQDEELRRTGLHMSAPVVAVHKRHSKHDDDYFTVVVQGRFVRLAPDNGMPRLGQDVAIVVGPGAHPRVVVADDTAERSFADTGVWFVDLFVVSLILLFGWGPGMPKGRACRAGFRGGRRTPAVIVDQAVIESPRHRVRRLWHGDGPYLTLDLALADGRVVRWRGCHSGGLPQIGGSVDLLGAVRTGAWAAIESRLDPSRRRATYSWPDLPLRVFQNARSAGSVG